MTVTPTALERAVLSSLVDWAHDIAATTGPPTFTAAILRDGRELVRAENRVEQTDDPTRHAEIEAIAHAARQLGRQDLSGCTLLSSCQPCEMCLAAMRWAGISRLIFSATQGAVGDAFFQFPRLGIADYRAACGGAFDYSGGHDEERALPLYGGRQ